jgi:mycothiol synthase
MTVTTDEVLVPDAPPIPGLAFRRPLSGERRIEDARRVAELECAALAADGVPWRPTGESLLANWDHDPTSDVARDAIIAELRGEIVAFATTGRSTKDGLRVHDTSGWVHPEWRRRGLGRALFRANRARAREVAAAEAPSEPAWLETEADDSEAGALVLYASEGLRPVRWYFLMRRPTLDDVPDVPLPDGLEVRPVREADHAAIEAAENEAFRDHWGHRESTEEDLAARLAEPDLDASLWQVAWDGDEIAGVVQNWIWTSENERLGVKRGWLERVSVRRPWRRRGLARALIARSFNQLRERGMEDAMLGVDSDNPTGALSLYMSLGFEIDRRAAAYRGPL